MCNLRVGTQAANNELLSLHVVLLFKNQKLFCCRAMWNIYWFHSSGFVVSAAAASSGYEYKPVLREWTYQVERLARQRGAHPQETMRSMSHRQPRWILQPFSYGTDEVCI